MIIVLQETEMTQLKRDLKVTSNRELGEVIWSRIPKEFRTSIAMDVHRNTLTIQVEDVFAAEVMKAFSPNDKSVSAVIKELKRSKLKLAKHFPTTACFLVKIPKALRLCKQISQSK